MVMDYSASTFPFYSTWLVHVHVRVDKTRGDDEVAEAPDGFRRLEGCLSLLGQRPHMLKCHRCHNLASLDGHCGGGQQIQCVS